MSHMSSKESAIYFPSLPLYSEDTWLRRLVHLTPLFMMEHVCSSSELESTYERVVLVEGTSS